MSLTHDMMMDSLFADEEPHHPRSSVIEDALARVLKNVRATPEGQERLGISIYTDKYRKEREGSRDKFIEVICKDETLDLSEELTRLVVDGRKLVPYVIVLLAKEYPSAAYVILCVHL